MTGSKLLKKLSILCYILGIIGVIIGIVAMTTNIGNILFQSDMEKLTELEKLNLDPKVFLGINFITSSLFTVFEGWLLGRAAKNGRKSMLLIILLILGIISPIIEIFTAGFGSILNMESIANIIGILIKAFILNQVLKVRKEAED